MPRLSVLTLLCLCVAVNAAPLGTAFHYQGRLEQNGVDFDGNANFLFLLYDADDALVADVSHYAVPVSNGLFSVELDFGAVFDGSAYIMEIQVLAGADPDWTQLLPRVPILAAPYALHALTGGDGGGAGPWVDDNGDLTYGGGTIGVTGWSSPIVAGKGVFVEGGIPTHGNVYAYDYDGGYALNLLLNAPGGNVAIGTTVPQGKLHVATTSSASPTIYATGSASGFAPIEAHNAAFGGTGIQGVVDGGGGRGIDGWVSGQGWGVVGTNTSANTFGILGSPVEGVAGVSNNALIPGGRFINNVPGGLGLEVLGLASVQALKITGGADLAERFDASEQAAPGTVMAIDPSAPGHMQICDEAYSRRVAGVVSGANGLDAGVVLGDGEHADGVAIALSGRVWVHCEASNGPIEPGTLLTSSARLGYAMAATDDTRAHGAILGKAMTELREGSGMVLVLVSLQ